MITPCIYNILDNILPNNNTSKHDTLRLEYLTASKLIENENYFKRSVPHFPASIFEPLLQHSIYQCYLNYIHNCNLANSSNASEDESEDESNDESVDESDKLIEFPESLGMLILNWPHDELILRNQIPSLEPPLKLFPSDYSQLASVKQAICQVGDMINVFKMFCIRLIRFISNVIFKCIPYNQGGPNVSNNDINKYGHSFKLRRLDVSGFIHNSFSKSHLLSDETLQRIRNSSIDTFGHKIDIFADFSEFTAGLAIKFKNSKTLEEKQPIVDQGFELLRNIIEESLQPDVGISLHLKKLTDSLCNNVPLPIDFFKVLALGGCEHVDVRWLDIDQTSADILYRYLPELVGISLPCIRNIEILEFLNKFKNIEQVSLIRNGKNGLTNSISNMSKGLKYLDLGSCTLHSKDLECLAMSIHADTLIQLNLSNNGITETRTEVDRNTYRLYVDSEAVGLITLCQNLKNIKVLIFENCFLGRMSAKSASNLANAFKDCDALEFLSMGDNAFSHALTNIFIDSLAQNKSLRYLGLNLPGVILNDGDDGDNGDEEWNDMYYGNDVYIHRLCKTFHEKLNRLRHSPVYISWYLTSETLEASNL